MLKASVKGQCAADNSSAAAIITANAGELKLKASLYESTFDTSPSFFNNLSLSVEKPGSFLVDYHVPKQDLRFQFMNSMSVLNKQLNMTCTHSRREKSVGLDGTLLINASNKVFADYEFNSGNCRLKYSYTRGSNTTFEPCYDVSKNSWNFAVSQRISGDDVVKASYQTHTNILGFEWSRASPFSGSFKVSASLNLAEEAKIPKLSAESTWNIDM